MTKDIQLHPLTIKHRGPLTALVVTVPTGPEAMYSALVHGTPVLMEDIDEGLSSRDAAESLGDPPGPGMWIWEGRISVHKSYDGDVDVDYDGKYRPATSDEVTRLRAGIPLEGWEEQTEEEPPEDLSLKLFSFPET